MLAGRGASWGGHSNSIFWPKVVSSVINGIKKNEQKALHTTYSLNSMCQKWKGNCGLWVLNEMILKKYAESLKKIVGATWEFELPAK